MVEEVEREEEAVFQLLTESETIPPVSQPSGPHSLDAKEHQQLLGSRLSVLRCHLRCGQ